jgi:4-hydroxybenzoate polyprenyltransferase/phosphoserine phosphatase
VDTLKNKQDQSVLIVDLDGTLLLSDSLFEQILCLVRLPLIFLSVMPDLLMSLMMGKGAFKQCLALHALPHLEVESLPYSLQLIDLIKKHRDNGFKVLLCTGAHDSIANKIAEYLSIFDGVIATNKKTNLVGENKAQALKEQFGDANFVYAANSSVDLAVWSVAAGAIVVNAPLSLTKRAERLVHVEEVIPGPPRGIRPWIKAFRIHQWIKNFLVFTPLVASHQLVNFEHWSSCFISFVCFGCVASSVYIQNDLLDLPHDRLHSKKRMRPFASGQLPLEHGLFIAPILLLLGLGGAWFLNSGVFAWLSAYFLLTFAYSIRLKKFVLLDCIVLAILYTLRIILGAAAIHNQLSHWLLGFSFFLFFSLAMMKRYAELETKATAVNHEIKGRGYRPSDLPLVLGLGLASAFSSILVMSLYLNSEQVLKLYKFPEFIWVGVPVLLFWTSWMWLKAHRGEMHEDPVLFAAKDKVSLLSGLIFAFVFFVATVGL